MSLAAMLLADRIERFMRYYDRWIHLLTFGRDQIVRSAVLRHVQSGDRLLDVGCGTGTLAVAAARQGAKVVAVDRSDRMLELARDKAARAGLNVDFRHGQAPFLQFDGGIFDVATATFFLSELSRDEASLAIRAMGEVVRPGGRVVIADEDAPRHPVLWILSVLQRILFTALAFAVLQELAPTRRHPYLTLIEDAGLMVRETSSYQSGSLILVVAERPSVLEQTQRTVRPLAAALPRGIIGTILRAAAWLALPVPVPAAVYKLGSPDARAPVFLTGNFLATVDAVRQALAGLGCFLIVEDTGGWNVWCASDAGVFTAERAAALMRLHAIEQLVAHRELVIPRLGGRIGARLAGLTRWEVVSGPIEARDIPEFARQREVTPAMRSLDRMYRLRERLRVSALTVVQLPVWLFPVRYLPRPVRGSVWRFAIAASCILPLFHYRLPGRTGIVKGGILGLGASAAILVGNRTRWAEAVAVTASAPFIGWIYQSTSPVVFWKRIWR